MNSTDAMRAIEALLQESTMGTAEKTIREIVKIYREWEKGQNN